MTGDTIERLRTYVEGADDILNGGIPKRSVVVITGAPGSGKTVLTLETLFNNARQGAKCLYLTTLSEPAQKLIRFTQRFSFFDEALLDKVEFRDIGTALRTGGLQEAFEQITQMVEEEQPDILAIDSYKAIRDLSPDAEAARLFTYDLASHVATWNVTTFLVGEYTLQDVSVDPEFAVADAIIYLAYDLSHLRGLREFQVLKLRGSGFNAGRHYYDIDSGGFHVYPRVGTVTETEHAETTNRVASGIPGLDELLHGGLLRGSATVIHGSTGIGKTLLSLHFMTQGAKQGEKGIIFAFEERPAQIVQVASGVGLDVRPGSGIEITFTNPVEILASRWLAEAREQIENSGAKRVLIDSISSMKLGMPTEALFLDLLYTTIKMFRSMGVTMFMTMETPEFLSASTFHAMGLSPMADNLILMRYVELESSLRRAIAVLKTRGASHENELREFTISSKGISVDGPFREFRGVLSGVPTPTG